jgi:hypothetical protein
LNYLIYGLILLVLFFFLINYLRKLHWDVIHSNLLDLVDEFSGNVYRRGFLARPVFHGTYKNCEVTINFSQERINSKRKNYINISIDKENKKSVTIVSMDWIKLQNESSDDLGIISMNDSQEYGVRIKSINNTTKNELISQMENLVPFNYVFLGQTGLIFEKESQNLGKETKLDSIKPYIETIYNLSNILK